MKDMADRVSGAYPLAWKAAYPRNITVPAGYADPRHYATSMIGSLMAIQDPRMRQFAHMCAYIMGLSLVAHRVPTYFIAPEFAYSVANTDLPGDFKFAELLWPLPAMLFVLPDDFVKEYYGFYAPFLAVSTTPAAIYPKQYARLPKTEFSYYEMEIKNARINMDYPIYKETEVPCDYNGSYRLTDGVEVFRTAQVNDSTEWERNVRGIQVSRVGAPTDQEEADFTDKASQLAVKMLLTVAALPTMIENGRVTRPARANQQGKITLPEMVSPNVIGRTYQIPRKYSERVENSGGRAKPRFVYRRGHYTWQAKRFKNIEFVSVNHMPRKVDGTIDFDTAGDLMANKFRACHERIRIEGFLFGDVDPNEGKVTSNAGANSP